MSLHRLLLLRVFPVVLALGMAAWLTSVPAADPKPAATPVGRWDLTVHGPDGDYPSWLEVRRSGRVTLVGSFVGRFGSARPVSRVEHEGNRIRFAVPPQWEQRKDDQVFEGQL